MRSIVWLLLPPIGFCPAVMPNGSNAMVTASRKAVCPNRRRIALRLPEQIGEDGKKVLTAVFDPLVPVWLREIPAIQVLRRRFRPKLLLGGRATAMARGERSSPVTLFLNSPYDPQAHLGKKRSTLWTGDIRSPHGNV